MTIDLYRFRIKALHESLGKHQASAAIVSKYSLELLDTIAEQWPEVHLWACEREFQGIFKRLNARMVWADEEAFEPDYKACAAAVIEELKAFVIANPNARLHVPAWTYAVVLDTATGLPTLALGFYYN